MGMGEFISEESLRGNEVTLIVNKRIQNATLGCKHKNDRMISVHFQDKPFNITVIQVYVPTTDAEEDDLDQFYEDLKDLLELIPKNEIFFIIQGWNENVGRQEIHRKTGKFGLRIQNKAGQRLAGLCQENTVVTANTLFQQHKRQLYTWTSPDGQHRSDWLYSLQAKMEKLHTVSKNKTGS